MVWRDIFWISLLSSVFLVQLSNVSPQPAFCPNYACSDCKIMEVFWHPFRPRLLWEKQPTLVLIVCSTLPPYLPHQKKPPHPLFIVSLWTQVVMAEAVGWVDFQEKKPRQNWSRGHFEATQRAKFSILKPNFWSGDAAMGMAHWHNPNRVNFFSNIL